MNKQTVRKHAKFVSYSMRGHVWSVWVKKMKVIFRNKGLTISATACTNDPCVCIYLDPRWSHVSEQSGRRGRGYVCRSQPPGRLNSNYYKGNVWAVWVIGLCFFTIFQSWLPKIKMSTHFYACNKTYFICNKKYTRCRKINWQADDFERKKGTRCYQR